MADLERSEFVHEVVDRLLHRLNDALRHVQVEGSGLQAAMSQQHLNDADVEATFHQIRGLRMAQGVARDPFGNSTLLDGLLEKVPHAVIRQRTTVFGDQQARGGSIRAPVIAQQFERPLG